MFTRNTVDITAIREAKGLRKSEMSALLGVSHSAQMNIEINTRHNGVVSAFYWVLKIRGDVVIDTLLDMWLTNEPKNKEQVKRLLKIAKRYKKDEFVCWLDLFQKKHPKFF